VQWRQLEKGNLCLSLGRWAPSPQPNARGFPRPNPTPAGPEPRRNARGFPRPDPTPAGSEQSRRGAGGSAAGAPSREARNPLRVPTKTEEREGFEPSVQALDSYNGLANRRLRPTRPPLQTNQRKIRANFSEKRRRRRDSNPRRSCPLNGFQDRRLQPLGHSSNTAYGTERSPPSAHCPRPQDQVAAGRGKQTDGYS
jgi:hypothetical protein